MFEIPSASSWIKQLEIIQIVALKIIIIYFIDKVLEKLLLKK